MPGQSSACRQVTAASVGQPESRALSDGLASVPGYYSQVTTHFLHAQLAGSHVEWRRGLCACQRNVVLTGQVHLPDDLRLELPVAQAAVAEALPLPLLSGIAVFAHPKPVCRASERCQQTSAKKKDVCLDYACEKTKLWWSLPAHPSSKAELFPRSISQLVLWWF